MLLLLQSHPLVQYIGAAITVVAAVVKPNQPAIPLADVVVVTTTVL